MVAPAMCCAWNPPARPSEAVHARIGARDWGCNRGGFGAAFAIPEPGPHPVCMKTRARPDPTPAGPINRKSEKKRKKKTTLFSDQITQKKEKKNSDKINKKHYTSDSL